MLVSSWYRSHSPRTTKIHCVDVASARYRAPDPWYAVTDNIVVRRLSPNNRKIEADDEAFAKLTADMLGAAGKELANVHLGTADRATTIKADLDRYQPGWLAAYAKKMADATKHDFQDYREGVRWVPRSGHLRATCRVPRAEIDGPGVSVGSGAQSSQR